MSEAELSDPVVRDWWDSLDPRHKGDLKRLGGKSKVRLGGLRRVDDHGALLSFPARVSLNEHE